MTAAVAAEELAAVALPPPLDPPPPPQPEIINSPPAIAITPIHVLCFFMVPSFCYCIWQTPENGELALWTRIVFLEFTGKRLKLRALLLP